MNKVFVTGATGILGKRVLKLLLEHKLEVVALSRSAENDQIISVLGAQPMKAENHRSQDM